MRKAIERGKEGARRVRQKEEGVSLVFLCYLVYLFLLLLRYHLRDTDFTAERALIELGPMYKVYQRDAQHRPDLA
jgi:hypothetical protein